MVDECVLRITVPHTLSSTVACIILKPFPTAFSHADPVSAKASRIQWLASTVKELRQLLPKSVVVRGVADSSGTGIPFVRIICPKNASVKLFKVIAAVKGKLEVILDNKAVHLQLQHAELQAAITEVLLTILTAAGWAALSTTSLIRCRALHMPAGQLHACECISMEPHPSMDANEVMMKVVPGWARFRPLSLINILHDLRVGDEHVDILCPSKGQGMLSSYLSASILVQLSARLLSNPIACSILPECRPAVLVGVQLSVSNEEEMRAEWLVNTGLELPDEVPCYFDIRFSEDSDAPVVTVPSCCIWSSNGLIVQPATKKTSVGQSVLQSLAGDLDRSPFQFWAQRRIRLHQSIDSDAQQQKSSPWQTAKDLEMQPASEDEQQLFKFGPAVALREMQIDMAPAAERHCAPNPDLQKLLSALSPDTQPRQLPSQEKIQSLPAPGPVLLRRAPVQVKAPVTAQGMRENASDPRMEAACDSGTKQDGAPAIQAPKVCAKPALAVRKRPGYALTAQAPPKQLLKTAAAPKQSMRAPPVQTGRPSAKPSAKPAVTPVPQIADHRQPQMIAKQGAAVCADAASPAAPFAKKGAQQGHADEAGAAAVAAKAPRNRTKAGDLDVAAVETKVMAKHAEQQLEKLSIPEIKCFLKAKKLPVGGKKGDLLERLVKFLNESV